VRFGSVAATELTIKSRILHMKHGVMQASATNTGKAPTGAGVCDTDHKRLSTVVAGVGAILQQGCRNSSNGSTGCTHDGFIAD
jgi:hypothetical protein